MKMIIQFLLTSAFVLSSSILLAAPPGPPATPIDGGLGLLLAGGAAYGIKKLMDAKKTGD